MIPRLRGCLLPGLLLVPAAMLAQATGTTTGDIRGSVTDPSGAPVAGATVTATSRETGLARSDGSGPRGEFAIRLLAPGIYRVSAVRAGFRDFSLEDVRVNLGSSTPLEIRLEIAAVAESVKVAARVDLIDPAQTGLSETIGERKIRDLPINQRNYLQFALTAPDVTLDRAPPTGAATTSGLSFNGQSPRYNNVLVDGVDNNDQAVGAVRSTFSQEAVEEYQVVQSPFAAEYGRASGGIVNIITRSGSNEPHGSAFYFFRDDSLSSDNLLTGARTPFRQDQYGASLGGPLLRDRLFYFAAAERLAVSDANVVTITDEAVSVIRQDGFDVQNGVVPFDQDRNTVLAKLDWTPSSSHAFALRGSYSDESDENQQPWGGLVAESGGGVRDIRDTAFAATGASVLSGSVSHEVRALYADRRHRLESLDSSGGVAVRIIGVATFGTQQFLPQPRDSEVYQLFDALSFFSDRASYKLGVDYLHVQLSGRLPAYFAGYYEFSALPGRTALQAFHQGIPVVFIQAFGDPSAEVGSNQLSAFAQGEWNLTPKLLVRVGLRYEYEDPVDPFPTDSDNWAPRVSFSWSGGPTWRIRGGAGRFFGVAPIAPAFVVSILGSSRVRGFVRTILGGPSPLEPWRLPNHRFGSEAEAGTSTVPLSVFRLGHYESVSCDQANVGFEKELAKDLLFHLDYLHARGRHVLVERNINPVVGQRGLRPDPTHSDILLFESTGNSRYDAVTVGLRTRLGGAFEAAAHYTYARGTDDYIDWVRGELQDPLNPSAERGPIIHVPRHKATLTAIYSTAGRGGPWWKRDWTFATIADYEAGLPFNELAGFDRNGNGDPTSDRPAGVGRNRGTLPTRFNVDLRIARQVRIRGVSLEGIVEFFNLFNRENVLEVNEVRFASPQLDPNPAFGQPTEVAPPRRIQIGARVSF